MRDMQNPSVVKQQINNPLSGGMPSMGSSMGGGKPKKSKSASKGNAPWLKTRRRLRTSVFRGMR